MDCTGICDAWTSEKRYRGMTKQDQNDKYEAIIRALQCFYQTLTDVLCLGRLHIRHIPAAFNEMHYVNNRLFVIAVSSFIFHAKSKKILTIILAKSKLLTNLIKL
ncbi:hypothetical protein V1478_011637 [Vespula squamosa]|uniref:Uncharacterized protein n=1 Tax=Vespula squamosa TaxID=30214 RepID=A0ABD2AF24_VESSQ